MFEVIFLYTVVFRASRRLRDLSQDEAASARYW